MKCKASAVKKTLNEMVGPDLAERAWLAYLEKWNAADNEDQEGYLSRFNQFLKVVEENGLPITYEQGWAISALACRHHQLCEKDCNVGLNGDDKVERWVLEDKFEQFFLASDIFTATQYDPRGLTFMLRLPDKRYNQWDGETWRVPML